MLVYVPTVLKARPIYIILRVSIVVSTARGVTGQHLMTSESFFFAVP